MKKNNNIGAYGTFYTEVKYLFVTRLIYDNELSIEEKKERLKEFYNSKKIKKQLYTNAIDYLNNK